LWWGEVVSDLGRIVRGGGHARRATF
jgi:hypothetical protein